MFNRPSAQHRRLIKDRLLKNRFESELKAISAAKQKLALALYAEAFPPALQRRMNKLPAGWLPEVQLVQARLACRDVGVCFGENIRKRVPHDKSQSYGNSTSHILVLDRDHPLSVRWLDIENRERDVKEQHNKLSREIEAALIAHGATTGRLVKAWPEIKEVVEVICGTASVPLPAPRMEPLNIALGLTKANPNKG